MKIAIRLASCAVATFFWSGLAQAGDADDLARLVNDFLAAADQEAVHETFWADDLVYTSSAGLRFGKAEIMEGFAAANDTDANKAAEPVFVYSSKDMKVGVYDDAAVVTFRLVGMPSDGSANLHFYNTGTFLKRDGAWQAVAWQATKIPSSD